MVELMRTWVKIGLWTLFMFVFFLGLIALLGSGLGQEPSMDAEEAWSAYFMADIAIVGLSLLVSFVIWIVGIPIIVHYAHKPSAKTQEAS